MANTFPQRQGAVWLVVAVLALISLALGLWDLVVERDGGGGWLTQALLPLLFLAFAVTMYRRHRGSAQAPHVPPAGGT
jgi:uncharacterized membrane protein